MSSAHEPHVRTRAIRIARLRCLASLLLPAALLTIAAGCGGAGSTATSGAPPASAYPQAGGEKSIEDFGSEATGSDRAALLGAFHAYLGAIAARDYPTACSHLAAPVQRSLRRLLRGAQGAGCKALLPKLLAPSAAAIAAEQDNGHITRVRAQGARAFVVFHAPGARLYQLTLLSEGGRWRAATLSASVLVPSAASLGRG